MTKNTIEYIDKALTHHSNYTGNLQQSLEDVPKLDNRHSKYLSVVEFLSVGYKGALGIKVNSLMEDYFKEVKVNNLTEAVERVRLIYEVVPNE